MDDYTKKIQNEYRTKAETLQKELIDAGFMASKVVKGEDNTDFTVHFFDGVDTFRMRRDYAGDLNVALASWPMYPHVSTSTRAEIYKKHEKNNVRVITAKKVQGLIDAEKAVNAELAELERVAIEKHEGFIDAVRAMERLGYKVTWSKERGGHRDGEITGGTILKNGIEFTFELGMDGYISKKIAVHYSVDNSLSAFGALADNKYHHEN